MKPKHSKKQKKNNYTVVILLFLIILALFAVLIILPTPQNKTVQQPVKPIIKIEKNYKVGVYNLNNKRVTFDKEEIATLSGQIFSVFSKNYPEYADSAKDIFVKDIQVNKDLAVVYFGGDEKALTDKMGQEGPYEYTSLITFALTQDPRIKNVEYKLKEFGSYFGPVITDRSTYIDYYEAK